MLRNSTLIMFATFVFVVTNANADSQRSAAASIEIELKALLRGELHEAFAVPAIHTRQSGPPIPQAPPKPLKEQPPNHGEPINHFTWVPGYWSYDAATSKFVWITGCWRKPPPGQRWLAGYWHQRTGGYVWIPGAWIDAKQEAAYFPRPPQARRSSPTGDLPSGRFHVAGSWRFVDGDYVWAKGFAAERKPGWIWIPAQYTESLHGFLFNDGYWDYDFAERGMLMAPLDIEADAMGANPAMAVSPIVALSPSILLHLFTDLARSSYQVGNYYDQERAIPWFAFGSDARRATDPLLDYYSQHRSDSLTVLLKRWHSYFERHPDHRPQESFAQQTQFLREHPTHPYRKQLVLALDLESSLAEESQKREHFVSLSSEFPERRAALEAANINKALPTKVALWKLPEVGSPSTTMHPIVLRISESHLRSQISRDVDRTANVDKIVLGARVRGASRTTGKVIIEVRPCNNRAKMQIKFAGRTVADTTGYTGPVAISTTSWTDFESLIDVDFDSATGFKALPATVTAQSGSRTNEITSNRNGLLGRIIRRAAWRRVNASRSQADAITRRDTTLEVQAEFTRSMTEELARISHASNLKQLLPKMLTADVSDHQHICSTDDTIYLCVGGHHCHPPTLPKSVTSNPVELWVHNSIVSNDTRQLFRAVDSFGSRLSAITPTSFMSSSNLLTKLADRVLPFDKVEELNEWTVLTLKPALLNNALAAND